VIGLGSSVSSRLINQDGISGPGVFPALPGDVNVNRCSKPSAGGICEEMMEAPLWWVELCYTSNGDSNGTVCGNRGKPTPIFTFRENTFGENTFGENTFGENTFGENTFGENTFGENTFGENTFGENIVQRSVTWVKTVHFNTVFLFFDKVMMLGSASGQRDHPPVDRTDCTPGLLVSLSYRANRRPPEITPWKKSTRDH
jgi:hypothetical protein